MVTVAAPDFRTSSISAETDVVPPDWPTQARRSSTAAFAPALIWRMVIAVESVVFGYLTT